MQIEITDEEKVTLLTFLNEFDLMNDPDEGIRILTLVKKLKTQ